ncbi:MAG: hypothetical protein ACD_58C00058G0003 [uncultured bacterium]|nr:MAG: hypothetical protein ACD_58C00058G0003 [uncultured bacterium]
MDILDGLNSMQKEAVLQIEGPVLILAGAGSGKTKTLTHRIAYLIKEKRISPYNILAVTFTNKAAAEMSNRISKLLIFANSNNQDTNNKPFDSAQGRQISNSKFQFSNKSEIINYSLENTRDKKSEIKLPWMGTFHSVCVKILRREIHQLGYKSSFTIYDQSDSLSLIKKCMKEQGIDIKNFNPHAVQHFISGAKNELLSPKDYEQYIEGYFQEIVGKTYYEYQKRLRAANALDFDDLIMKTVELFKDYSEILNKYQNLFKYILIDEYQDTNTAQYQLVKLLATRHKNICVVGDDWQCLPAGTEIATTEGNKKIEKINIGEKVISCAGRGEVFPQKVTHIKKNSYKGKLLKITTFGRKKILCTPNHIFFTKFSLLENLYFIYLMYSEKMGYRIGQTKSMRYANNRQKKELGLNVRANQECADKMWILKIANNKEEAYYWENYLSLKYQIPTLVFRSDKNRTMKISQKTIKKIYCQINTRENAKNIFKDFNLFFNYPHHIPQAVSKTNISRLRLNLTLFQDRRRSNISPWNLHRISINSSNLDLRSQLELLGYRTRKGKYNDWRLEITNLDLGILEKVILSITDKIENLSVVKKAFLIKDLPFSFQPAGHLRELMEIAVLEGSNIISDRVKKIEEVNYNGAVYDLNINKTCNYIAEGVVVHNSIYGFRGANFKNILNFEKHYPDAKVIKLEQNYRSTKTILAAADKIIKQNINRTDKTLWTENDEGAPITIYEAPDQREEVEFVVREIQGLTQSAKLKTQNHNLKLKTDQPINPFDKLRVNQLTNPPATPEHSNGGQGQLNNFVILYRTNAQSRVIEEILLDYGIPYRLIGAVRFYERKEIKDIIAYLRLIANPGDEVSLERIINVPARGIGTKTLEKFRKSSGVILSNSEGSHQNRDSSGLPQNDKVQKFLDMIEKMRVTHSTNSRSSLSLRAHPSESKTGQASSELRVDELIDKICDVTGYKKYLLSDPELGEGRWENVEELKSVAQKYVKPASSVGGLDDFLAEVSLVSDIDSYNQDSEAITLMTLHNAKGLEFPVVFMVGMEEGLFPHSRSTMEPADLEEERRLAYVGITRAKERLYLTYAQNRLIYGQFQNNLRSRFIDEIPEYLLDVI